MPDWSTGANVASTFSGVFAPSEFFFTITAIFVALFIYFHKEEHKFYAPFFLFTFLSTGFLGVILLFWTPMYIWDVMQQKPPISGSAQNFGAAVSHPLFIRHPTPQPILSTTSPPSGTSLPTPPAVYSPPQKATVLAPSIAPPLVKPVVVAVVRPTPSPPHAPPRIKRVVMPVPINHPRPSPPIYPQLTKETPIVVESTWSDDDSTTAANSLRDALRGDLFTVVDDNSVAPIFIKVEDVTEPPCSEALTCSLSVEVIGQYADGQIFFDQPFTGNEPETVLVNNGYDQAMKEAVSKAHNYIVSITKN